MSDITAVVGPGVTGGVELQVSSVHLISRGELSTNNQLAWL